MKKKLLIAAVAVAILFLIFISIVNVSDGYIKIAVPRLVFKEVKVLAPGIHILPPFFYSVKSYSTSPSDLETPEGLRVRDRIGSAKIVRFKVSYQFDKENIEKLKNTGGDPPAFIIREFEEEIKKLFLREKEIITLNIPLYQKEVRAKLSPFLKSCGINVLSFSIIELSVDYGDFRRNELAKIKIRWEEKKRKVILVGMDALDLRIMRPLLNAGELPNFAFLIKNGTSGILKSVKPLLSPLIWTTIATGVTPDKHGILDFIQNDENSNLVPITSRMRKVPAVWNILSEMNIPVGFVAWWATWPAEKVNGFIVSERLAYQLFNLPIDPEELKKPQGKVYPPGEYEGLTRLISSAERIGFDTISKFVSVPQSSWDAVKDKSIEDSTDKLLMLRNLIASTGTYHAAGLELYKKYKPVLFSPYFEGTDVIGHLFMEYYPPKRENISDMEFRAYRDAVPEYYKYIDKLLADYIELVDDDTDLLIVSDHGFKSGVDRPVGSADIKALTATQWHDIDGTIIMYGKSFKKGYLISKASVYDVLPTVLALLNLPADINMEGNVLTEAFDRPIVEVPRIQDYQALVPTHGATEDVAKNLYEKEMLKKLAKLGYISPDTGKVTSEGESILTDVNKAGVFIERKQWAEAEKILLAVTKREPRLTIAWGNLARVYRGTGDKNKEVDSYVKMLETAGTQQDVEIAVTGASRVLFEQDKRDRAIGLLESVLKKYPDSYDVNAAIGKIYLNSGFYRRAIAHFQKVLAQKPDEVDILNNIALAHFNLGEELKASQYWSKSFKLKPEQLKEKTINYYLNLGILYMQQKKYQEATETFQSALAQNSKYYRIWCTLGNVYIHTQSFQNAEKAFKEAIKLTRDPIIRSGAYLGLVIVYNQTKQPELELQCIKAGIKDDPENYVLHRFYALHFLKQNDYDSAAREYETVINLKEDDWEAMMRLGAIYAEKGRREEAIALLKRSISINPNQPRVRQALRELGAE